MLDLIKRAARYRPNYPLAALIWQSIFSIAVIYWIQFTPKPNLAMGVLAVVAVVMAVRDGQGRLEKAVWIVLATSLFFIEMQAGNKDRQEVDAENRAQFQQIVARFTEMLSAQQRIASTQQENFSKILNKTAETLDETMATLHQATGDPDSPPYVLFGRFGRQGDLPEARIGDLEIRNPSKRYSSYDVVASMGRLTASAQSIPALAGIPFRTSQFPVQQVDFPLKDLPTGTGKEFQVQIFCRAGIYHERLAIFRISDVRIAQAVRVFRDSNRTRLLIQRVDDDFPPDFRWQ